MGRHRRPNPDLVVRFVGSATAREDQADAMAALGRALADLEIDRARDRAAAAQGLDPTTFDRRGGALEEEARRFVAAVGARGVA